MLGGGALSSKASDDAADDLLLGFFCFLLQQLSEVLSDEDSGLEISTRDHIEGLHRALELLTTLFKTASMRHADHEKWYQQLLRTEANLLSHLVEDFCVGKTNETMSLQLLGRLKFINLAWIMERINCEASLISPVKDQFENFCEEILLLRSFLTDTQRDGIRDMKFKEIHGNIEAMSLKAGSVVYASNVTQIKEDMVEEMSSFLPDLLEMIKFIKADMRDIYPNVASSRETGGSRNLIFILEELKDLLNCVKPHMNTNKRAAELQNAQGEVQILILFLDKFEEHCIEFGEGKALGKCVINLLNGAKCITDPLFSKNYPDWFCMLKCFDAMEEVREIMNEMARINDKISCEIVFLLEHVAEQLCSDGHLKIAKGQFDSLHKELKLVRSSPRISAMNQHIGAQLNEVNHETPLIAQDQFETLCEDMRLLRTFYTFYNEMEKFPVVDEIFTDDVHSHIEYLGLKEQSAIYCLHTDEIKEGKVEENSTLLADMVEKIKFIKAGMRKIHPDALSSDVSDQGRLVFHLEELNNLLNDFDGDAILRFVKPQMRRAGKIQIDNVWIEVQILKLFLDTFEEQCIEIRERVALEKHVINVINGVKCITDPSSPTHYPVWYCMFKQSDAMEEVQIIKKEVARINDKIFSVFDFLLEHMEEQLSSEGRLKISEAPYESFSKKLKLMRSSLPRAEIPQHLVSQLYEMVLVAEDLYVGNVNEAKIRTDNAILLQILGRSKLMSLFCIMERLNHNASLIPQVQLETLLRDMRLLTNFYCMTQKFYELNVINSHIEALALEHQSAIYSLNVDDIVPHLVEKVNLIKADIWKIFPPSSFPNTDERRCQTVFLRELNKLLDRRHATSSRTMNSTVEKDAKACIENVRNELQFLISFLDNFDNQCFAMGEIEALEERILDMANEAKYATDPIFLREHPVWYCKLKLFDVMEEVRLIKKEVERVNEKISSEMLSSQDDTLINMGEVIVGFEDEAVEMIEQLTGGSEQLNVTSIVGMGGLGKTTLAKKLYNNPSVVDYFHVRAWCCISQVFEERSVLLDILRQVDELPEELYQKKAEGDLQEMLRKSLKGRRYLIVVDDIWDIKAWTTIRKCFDDDHNGSRIIFTTRLEKVALKVQARNSTCHKLRFFNDDESQKLLKKKLFPGGRCPPAQVEIVKQIAQNCKGLPFAVVLMAGILTRKKKEEWEQVAKSLSQHTDDDLQNLSMKLLEYSYQNLPHHLRRCFLYLGAFPEDKEIPLKKLTWLWIAEGFILKTEKKILGDIAMDYLMDLIGRSLVMIAEKGSSGGVKACRIHDVSRSFTLAKAEEENFLLLFNGKQQVDRLVESYNSNPITCPEYRLSIYSMLNDLEKWPSSLRVRSLLHFAPASRYDASRIFSHLKDLYVLDLGRLLLKDLSSEIELLVHLRLLAVQIQSRSIPSSISNLQSLEIFLVKGARGEVEFPDTIWSMASLRHLHVDKRASAIWDKRVNDSPLDKLETFSTPTLRFCTNSWDLARSLPNLRKLKCLFTAYWSSNEKCNYYPDLRSLLRLESLKVFYYSTNASHGRFSFPKNLKKLTLSMFRLPWSDITAIEKALPNLEVLKLLSRAFEGEEWEMEGEFPKLKYLKLESLDIKEWNMSSEDHFPLLKKLVVHRCKQLNEIPPTFGYINTLEMIEVKWCNGTAANSAKGIYEEQQEYGNEGFKVIIHPYPADSGPAPSS